MLDQILTENYLTGIPQEVQKHGLCKTLLVRREVIHIKHIMTELFVRRTVDYKNMLAEIGWDLDRYMEFLTGRLRNLHKITRNYVEDINDIVKEDRDNFFPVIKLYDGLNNCIVLDFDGVVTSKSFGSLYRLCIERCKTVICSANPTIEEDWFTKRGLPLPHKIYSMKGKKKKINKLIYLQNKHDFCFYVDNEGKYLEYGWLFGMKTFIWANRKIKNYSMNSK